MRHTFAAVRQEKNKKQQEPGSILVSRPLEKPNPAHPLWQEDASFRWVLDARYVVIVEKGIRTRHQVSFLRSLFFPVRPNSGPPPLHS